MLFAREDRIQQQPLMKFTFYTSIRTENRKKMTELAQTSRLKRE